MAAVSLRDTRLARPPFLLRTGLMSERSSKARSVSALGRCCYHLYSCPLSRGVSASKGAGLDVGVGVGSLRGVCGGGRVGRG